MTDISLSSTWHYPTNILLQSGGLQKLPSILAEQAIIRPLWVVDPYWQSQPLFNQVIELSNQLDIRNVLFSNFTSNPTDDDVTLGCQQFNTHQCDAVIIIGGGSALDIGKVIAVLAQQSLQLWDLIDENNNYQRADIKKIAPIFAIPTTAGTGSEVGRAALITNTVTHEKKIIFHPNMLPTQVILDPLLSLSLPPDLTAATGMDALTHNIEA